LGVGDKLSVKVFFGFALITAPETGLVSY